MSEEFTSYEACRSFSPLQGVFNYLLNPGARAETAGNEQCNHALFGHVILGNVAAISCEFAL